MDLAMRLLKEEPTIHPGDNQINPNKKGRRYFPTTLVHEDATEGIQRKVNPFDEEEGTFEEVPYNEETGFTRSEPMDIAWQLLKEELSRVASSPTLTRQPRVITGGQNSANSSCTMCNNKILQEPCLKCGRPASLGANVLTGEPMDIAFQLLKQSLELEPPMTQGVEETPPIQEDIPTVDVDTMGGGDDDCCEKVRAWVLGKLRPNSQEEIHPVNRRVYDRWMNASCEDIKSGRIENHYRPHQPDIFDYEAIARIVGCSEGFDSDFQNIHTGEPMDIAFRLLKERVSPEAKRHKLEYDKKYESNPVRVKYREDLNRERRKRGIYGSHDHMDVSHTEGNKLTLEGEHENRARHFKEKGTLRDLKMGGIGPDAHKLVPSFLNMITPKSK